MTDYTTLLQRLQPKPDGEPSVLHRTGVVSAINSDRTLNVTVAGVVIPSLPAIHSAPVGATVEILVWRGDMLVLGAAGASRPLGFLGWNTTTTDQTGISTVTDITGLGTTVTVAANRRLRVTGSLQVVQRTGAGIAFAEVREGSTALGRVGVHTLQTNEVDLFKGSVIIVNPSAGAHTYKLSLTTTANTVDTQSGATFPHWLLVEDIGAV